MSATAAKRKAWRYVVTESGGCLAEQCPVGGHIVDWMSHGREYTWNVYDFKPGSSTFGKCIGWATGVLRDRGHMVDGEYVTT